MRRRKDRLEVSTRVADVFDVFLRPVEGIRKNPRRAMRSPRSVLDRVGRKAGALLIERIEREGPERFFGRMLDLIAEQDESTIVERVQKHVAEQRRTMASSAEGASLLALYDAADARGPMSPLLAISSHPLDESAVHELSVLGAFDEAARCRRERRASRLFDAVPDLIDKVYRRHLREAWAMAFLAKGEWPSRPPGPLAALARQASDRLLEFPGVVDRDAVRIRNAVVHRHAEYVPARNEVALREQKDANRASSTDWSATLTLAQFDERLKQIWAMGGPLGRTLRAIAWTQLLLKSDLFGALSLLRASLAGDAAARATLESQDWNTRFEASFVRSSPPADFDPWFLPQPRQSVPAPPESCRD